MHTHTHTFPHTHMHASSHTCESIRILSCKTPPLNFDLLIVHKRCLSNYATILSHSRLSTHTHTPDTYVYRSMPFTLVSLHTFDSNRSHHIASHRIKRLPRCIHIFNIKLISSAQIEVDFFLKYSMLCVPTFCWCGLRRSYQTLFIINGIFYLCIFRWNQHDRWSTSKPFEWIL